MTDVSAAGLLAAISETFLPALCLHCGEPVAGGEVGLCGDCWTRVVPHVGATCPRCGLPTEDALQACLECHRAPPPQLGSVVWGAHEGVLRTAVLALKHGDRDELAEALGRRLVARLAVEPWIAQIDVVTAVPSHRLHRLRRGKPAAERIAGIVGRTLDRPVAQLLRRQGLHRQTGRSRAERLRLPRRSFSARATIDPQRVLVVDDVATTRTTLRRAAEVLYRAGAAAVYCAVLAQTPDSRRMT